MSQQVTHGKSGPFGKWGQLGLGIPTPTLDPTSPLFPGFCHVEGKSLPHKGKAIYQKTSGSLVPPGKSRW